jgi:3-oxoacyl-[acyl-carrier protein] reductase
LIIIAGASRGIGKDVADFFHKKNKKVIGLSRTKIQCSFDSLLCDVGDYLSVKKTANKIKNMKEPIEAFINTAGVASMNMAVTTDEATVRKLININLIGTIYCCQLFAPIMIRYKKGSFVNFSTIAVPLALKGESIYIASKAGVEAFSRTFAREMSDFNIRVNCIAPGPIKTDLLKGITDNQIKEILSSQLIRKQFQKSDICNIIDLLLDKRSNSITGHVFNIGGV